MFHSRTSRDENERELAHQGRKKDTKTEPVVVVANAYCTSMESPQGIGEQKRKTSLGNGLK